MKTEYEVEIFETGSLNLRLDVFVQSKLFSISTPFWAFDFFSRLCNFFYIGCYQAQNFFGPTNVEKQLWVLEAQLYLLFYLASYGVFLPFLGPLRLFWGQGQVQNFIVTYLCRLSTLVLGVQPYLIILVWPHLGISCPF